jgi:hypothetical protein
MKNNKQEVEKLIQYSSKNNLMWNFDYSCFAQPFSALHGKIIGHMWFEGFGRQDELKQEIVNMLNDNSIAINSEDIDLLPFNSNFMEN